MLAITVTLRPCHLGGLEPSVNRQLVDEEPLNRLDWVLPSRVRRVLVHQARHLKASIGREEVRDYVLADGRRMRVGFSFRAALTGGAFGLR